MLVTVMILPKTPVIVREVTLEYLDRICGVIVEQNNGVDCNSLGTVVGLSDKGPSRSGLVVRHDTAV